MKKISIIAAALAALTSLGANALTLRLADTMPTGLPNSEGVAFFAKKVKEYSNGEMDVKVFASGILGSERENVEQLNQGALDMARVGAATLDSFTPAVQPITLPYMFETTDHLIRAMEGKAGEALYANLEKDGIYPISYMVIGPRSFYTKNKPINTPDDLKGMKIRVMNSKMAMKTIKLMGGAPTPLPMGDVFTAMDQGVIDGAENAPQSLIEHRHGEVAKYYSFDEHFNYPEFILISKTAMSKLTPEQLEILKKAGKEATDYEIGLAKAAIDESVKQSEGKVTFNQVDKALFKEKVQPLYEEVIAENPIAKEMIELVQQAKP
ncbi:TRAP transporter substrate-binding protein [Aeromonas veronii]